MGPDSRASVKFVLKSQTLSIQCTKDGRLQSPLSLFTKLVIELVVMCVLCGILTVSEGVLYDDWCVKSAEPPIF